MITLCWAAKGGSGTSVVAAASALSIDRPTLLVDLAGDLPAVLGQPESSDPGIGDWLGSSADVDRLARLEQPIDGSTALVPVGSPIADVGSPERWAALAQHFATDDRAVIVDAGTGTPPAALVTVAERRWIVTRSCFLALRAGASQGSAPTGIVLIHEPGRCLRPHDVEAALGAPIVAELLLDPAVARAVDSGLLGARLPGAFRRRLGEAA